MIALSFANKFPPAQVVATDISEEALSLAQENAQRLGLAQRVRFVQGNLLENFTERFDLIVANLPYVSRRAQSSLSREVRHDPELALFGGEEGDEMIRRLIAEASARLEAGGQLALEVGIDQIEGLSETLLRKNYHDIESKRDYSGTPRFLFARYG